MITNIIKTKVRHGSPAYEVEEIINDVLIEKAWPDHKTIEFESGYFTRMTHEEFDRFIEDGTILYNRKFPDGNAYESMFVA